MLSRMFVAGPGEPGEDLVNEVNNPLLCFLLKARLTPRLPCSRTRLYFVVAPGHQVGILASGLRLLRWRSEVAVLFKSIPVRAIDSDVKSGLALPTFTLPLRTVVTMTVTKFIIDRPSIPMHYFEIWFSHIPFFILHTLC